MYHVDYINSDTHKACLIILRNDDFENPPNRLVLYKGNSQYVYFLDYFKLFCKKSTFLLITSIMSMIWAKTV